MEERTTKHLNCNIFIQFSLVCSLVLIIGLPIQYTHYNHPYTLHLYVHIYCIYARPRTQPRWPRPTVLLSPSPCYLSIIFTLINFPSEFSILYHIYVYSMYIDNDIHIYVWLYICVCLSDYYLICLKITLWGYAPYYTSYYCVTLFINLCNVSFVVDIK